MKSLKTGFHLICLLLIGNLIPHSAPPNILKHGLCKVAVAGDLCSGFEFFFSP